MVTVHTLSECRAERRHALLTGVWCGFAIALVIAFFLGGWLASYQERTYDNAFTAIQAQHRIALEAERKRVARYAEIDLLARQYDAMAGRE